MTFNVYWIYTSVHVDYPPRVVCDVEYDHTIQNVITCFFSDVFICVQVMR